MDILFREFGRGWILYIKNYLIYNMDNFINDFMDGSGEIFVEIHTYRFRKAGVFTFLIYFKR